MRTHSLITAAAAVISTAAATVVFNSPVAAADRGDDFDLPSGRVYYALIGDSDRDDLDTQVYSVDTDGSGRTDVYEPPYIYTPPNTSKQDVHDPTVSANGSQVLVNRLWQKCAAWQYDHGFNCLSWEVPTKTSFVLVGADGTNPHVIGEGAGPAALSADGRMFAYNRYVAPGDLRLAIKSTDGVLLREIRYPSTYRGYGAITWSPDGGQIALDGQGVTLVNLRSGAFRRVAGSRWTSNIAWSPDGATLAFDSDYGLWLIDRDGSDLHSLPLPSTWSQRPRHFAFSPDGAYLVVSDTFPSHAEPVQFYRLSDGRTRPLTTADGVQLGGANAVWAPAPTVDNRTTTATTLTQTQATDGYLIKIKVTGGAAGTQLTITDGLRVIRRPVLRADGTSQFTIPLTTGRHVLRAAYPGTAYTKDSISKSRVINVPAP